MYSMCTQINKTIIGSLRVFFFISFFGTMMCFIQNVFRENGKWFVQIWPSKAYAPHTDTKYVLDSAGDGGLMVSGLTQSDGDGDRSRLVVMWPRPSRPAECPSESLRWPPRPVECAKWEPGRPSGMLFSDRNSSRSAYCARWKGRHKWMRKEENDEIVIWVDPNIYIVWWHFIWKKKRVSIVFPNEHLKSYMTCRLWSFGWLPNQDTNEFLVAELRL